MINVCFVDTETAGLHPDKHPIWEVALITPDGNEHVWQFPIVEIEADPFALQIGRYWERRWSTGPMAISRWTAVYDAHKPDSRMTNFPDEGLAIKPAEDWCRHFQRLTANCHLAGAVVSFDEERLRRLLWKHGVLPRWHYHLIDVEALAVGYLAGCRQTIGEIAPHTGEAFLAGTNGWKVAEGPDARPPWKSDELTEALGIVVDNMDKHTALGDARWAKAIYDRVMGA